MKEWDLNSMYKWALVSKFSPTVHQHLIPLLLKSFRTSRTAVTEGSSWYIKKIELKWGRG